MKHQYLPKQLLIMALFGTLTSCGGGDGSDVAGIGGTGIRTAGTITAFGSIFVNGIEFETGLAAISLDDNPGAENQLRLGMVVVVDGTVDAGGTTGTAINVSFDDEVQGPVTDIVTDPRNLTKTLTVLDVQVQVDSASTVFDEVTFDTLALNDVVEVSGFVDGAGVIQATRIEKKEDFVDGVSELELKGIVSDLSGTTFTLGSFTVDFSAADLSHLPGGVISNGLQVEVKGTLSGSTINATDIEQEDDLFSDDEDKVSLEGVIGNFISNADFTIAGQSVNASSAELKPVDLTLGDGVKVEVEGSITAGVLQAVKVEAD